MSKPVIAVLRAGLPAFRGVAAVHGIEGLTNPRGFIVVDKNQRNPAFPNVFPLGVAVAIAPTGKTPRARRRAQDRLHDREHGHGDRAKPAAAGRGPARDPGGDRNAICLADFGDGGVAFIAQPQIPPRNVNWSAEGKWAHHAKVAFEKDFIGKVRCGESETFYEKFALDLMGARKLKA